MSDRNDDLGPDSPIDPIPNRAPDAATEASGGSSQPGGIPTPLEGPAAASVPESARDRGLGSAEGGAGQAKKGRRARKEKKRRPWPIKLLRIVLFPIVALLALLAVAAAALFVWYLLDIRRTVDHLPSNFVAYAQIASASELFESVIGLKAVDEFSTDPAFASAHELLIDLRSSGLLKEKWVRDAIDLRMDFMLAEGMRYVAVVDFGVKSMLTRLVPYAGSTGLVGETGLIKVGGLRYEEGAAGGFFGYSAGGQTFFLAIESNLLLLSNDRGLLDSCRTARTTGNTLGERFKRENLDPDAAGRGMIRFVADSKALAKMALDGAGDALKPITSRLTFEGQALVDVDATNERISLRASIPVTSSDADMAKIVGRNSPVPAALEALPDATEYFSMINLADVGDLARAAVAFGGESVAGTYKQADDACKLALGMDIDRLLFSWTGAEAGVFGVAKSSEPVFFVRVSDESARKDVFAKAFNNLLMGSDTNTVIDDIRLTRLDFPFYIDAVLSLFGVRVPEPYYAVEGGFVFFSTSAENVALSVNSMRMRKTLSAQEAFRDMTARSSADMGAGLFYTIGRSVPFFLKGSSPAIRALKLYGRGLAAIRFRDGRLEVSLDAVAVAGGGVNPLSGFPFKAEGRLSGAFEAFKFQGRGRATIAYAVGGSKIVVRSPEGGSDYLEIGVDSAVFLVPERDSTGAVTRLWYATAKGAVGLVGGDLKEARGFPTRLGASIETAPVAVAGRLLVALDGGSRFVSVAPDATVAEETLALEDRLLSSPKWSREIGLAVYARAFLGKAWLLDASLNPLPGWPADVDGISSGSPFFLRAGGAPLVLLACEDGMVYAWKLDGSMAPGFPIALPSPLRATPATTRDGRYALAVSEDGKLTLFDGSGAILRTGTETDARGTTPLFADTNGDGREEAFLAGGGNSIWGYSSDLVPLQGFPLKGGFEPRFVDLDADGTLELVTAGFDDNVHAYVLR